MPWLEFTQDFDFTPPEERRVTIAYKAGSTVFVPTAHADAAIASGAAIKAKKVKNETADIIGANAGQDTPAIPNSDT